MNYEERIQRAVYLFKNGYNCAQAVTAAFADIYGLTEDQAFRVAASFGAGIGRLRETCGAASGMFILAGLDCGSPTAGDKTQKEINYKVVRHLATLFRERNGSLICGELLGLRPRVTVQTNSKQPVVETVAPSTLLEQSAPSTLLEQSAPLAEYCKKRPCVIMVQEGARIFAEYLEEKNNYLEKLS